MTGFIQEKSQIALNILSGKTKGDNNFMIITKLLKLHFCWPVFRINSCGKQIQKKYIFMQDFLILLYNHLTPLYG